MIVLRFFEILIFFHIKIICSAKLLLVSLDGFRWDFSKLGNTPTIDWIKENGVTSKTVRNVFPTNTIPNHQSIVTGMYAENHGMINNDFLHASRKGEFHIDSNETFWWNQSVPIWMENEWQAGKSGVCYWPGFNVEFNGSLASFSTATEEFMYYGIPFAPENGEKVMSFESEVGLVSKWLRKPDVNFVALYLAEPDSCFHENGPDSTDEEHRKIIRQCVSKVDGRLETIIKAIKRIGDKHIDVIVTGDHGHVNLNSSRVIWLNDYFNTEHAQFIFGYTSCLVYTSRPELIYGKLKGASPHFDVYLREEIPESYHFKNNDRAPELLIVGEPGWLIADRKLKPWFIKNRNIWVVGDHGYSNYVKDMNPGFYAFGPSFKKNFTIDFMELTDIYELMCSILHIKPHKNDGNFTRVKEFLIS